MYLEIDCEGVTVHLGDLIGSLLLWFELCGGSFETTLTIMFLHIAGQCTHIQSKLPNTGQRPSHFSAKDLVAGFLSHFLNMSIFNRTRSTFLVMLTSACLRNTWIKSFSVTVRQKHNASRGNLTVTTLNNEFSAGQWVWLLHPHVNSWIKNLSYVSIQQWSDEGSIPGPFSIFQLSCWIADGISS